jgi:gramicidin S synthase 2/tyrocidine synthetase-3
MHEIVADGSSTVILGREIRQLLEAHQRSVDITLPLLPIQYKDYAVWQQQRLDSADNTARRYWHEQLHGPVKWLDLPFDHPLTPQTRRQTSTYICQTSAQLMHRLQELAQTRQVTLFMLLQATLCTLLMRLTGQKDIILAAPISGREHPDVQNVVGFFLNTILLRHRPDSAQSFADLLSEVKLTTLQGLEQQHYPFERLLDELDLPNEPYRFPVTPVIFNMLNFIEAGQSESGTRAEAGRLNRGSKAELQLDALEKAEGLRFRAHFRKALFKEQTIEYLMGELLQLLEQIAANPDQPLGAYDLFGQCELAGETYPQALNSPYLEFLNDL